MQLRSHPDSAPTAAGAASRQSEAQTCSQSFLPLPDPARTPGVKNPDVTESTIEDAYGLPYAGSSATAAPITDVWTTG